MSTQDQLPEVPKSLTTEMPRVNPDEIVGRESALRDLHQKLFNKKQVVVVNGMGGLGKTTLAQVYVDQYWDDYQHIAWITQTSEHVLNDFANASGLLKSLDINSAGDGWNALYAEIIRKLDGLGKGPNLLVLDNVDESTLEIKHRLPDRASWHVLMTSRIKLSGFEPQEVGFISDNAAYALFKKHFKRKHLNESQIRELIESVGRHTLTVEILAKIAHRQRYSFEQLKEALPQNLKANVPTNRSGDGNIDHITTYLSSLFDLSALPEEEVWLLKQFLVLPSTYHSYVVLDDLLNPTSEETKDINLSELLDNLTLNGWLLHNEKEDSYKLHLILREAILNRSELKFEDVATCIKALIDRLSIDQNKDNPVDKFIWAPYGTQVLIHVENLAKGRDEENLIARLQGELGSILQELGDYPGAKTLLEKALKSDQKNLGEDHRTIAIRYSNLGLVLRDLGDFQGSKTLLEKALNLAEKNLGEDHPTTAIRYSNLGVVIKSLGDYQGAKTLLQKALKLAEKGLGEDHPTTAIRYSNLGAVIKNLGDYQGAKTLFEKALKSDEKNWGENHPSTAISYSNLGSVLQDLGDYQGAKNLLVKALESNEKNFGKDHPTTAIGYSNLGLVLQNLGDYQGAKTLLEKALKSAEKNLGKDHPTTAIRYLKLGAVLQDLGEIQRGRKLAEKALRIFEQTFDEDHPHIAKAKSVLKSFDEQQ